MTPTIWDLGDSAIGAPVSGVVITQTSQDEFIPGSSAGASFSCNFTFGSGGGTVKVDIETSLDQGFSWVPIARFAFTSTSAQKIFNVNAATAKLTPLLPAPLPDDTAIDGIMGDRIRAKLTTTGSYSGNSSVSVRAVLR